MGSLPGFDINANAVVIILLGIISCLFPLISTMTIGMISGFAFFMIAIALLLFGMSTFAINKLVGIVTVILAFISIFFSLSLIFNPEFVSGFVSFITYFVGLLMIISGVFYVFAGKNFLFLNYFGIASIIFGVLYIILGVFVGNPIHLGLVVGIWLILSGIFDCFRQAGYYD